MKHLYTLIFLLSIGFGLTAQNPTTDPEFPISTAALTLTFDATGTDLAASTEDLYAHTGVTVNGLQWQKVIGNWGATTQPKFTKVSANIYTLTISPSIAEFYGVTSGTISEICMVIRNTTGDKKTADLFLQVYPETLDITITQPDTTKIYLHGNDVEIKAASLAASSMSLSINGNTAINFSGNSIDYTYTIDTKGYITFEISATDGTETQNKSLRIFVKQDVQTAELPSPNLKDGVNYIDNQTVVLVLFAPNKDFVFVKGSFDNWSIGEDNQMKRTSDGNRYWLTISGLTPQQEYAYQYIVDGELYIADPYTDKILDPWNDSWISTSTYSGLLAYPTGKAEGILSVFQTAQTPYLWKTENFERPAAKDLIIYELHIRDFIAKHDFKTLIDTFEYFTSLGINAIELMPVNEFEGNSSWGYNPSFYFAPDKYYGPKNDFKAFVDKCHENGIAVIIDMVMNHSYGQSPFLQLYFDPEAGEYGQPSAENPWYNQTSPNPVYSWGSDFDHESEATKTLLTRINRYWIEEYNVDGYRFDFTKGFTNRGGDGWAYDASRIQILKNMADSIWKIAPDAYVICEHLADNSEETVLANYGLMLWGNINYNYNEAAMGWIPNSDFKWISYKNRGWTQPNLVGYMESHDEERIMFKNLEYGNGSGAYQIKSLATALDRIKLVATFFIPIPGPKMIWQFGELGYDISIDDPCRVCDKPIKWDYYANEDRHSLYMHYSQLIDLKKNNPIFGTSDFTINSSGTIKQIQLRDTENEVLIIGNFGVTETTAGITFPTNRTWSEFFTGTTYESKGSDSLTLAPGEYRIYSAQNLQTSITEHAPVASNITVSGLPNIGSRLSGTYTFYDKDGDAEGTSQFRWYRVVENQFVSITGATEQTYIPTSDDLGLPIVFGVIPIATSEILPQGEEKFSSPVVIGTQTDQLIAPTWWFDQNELNLMTSGVYQSLKVYDVFGHLVFETDISTNPQTVSLPQLACGMYFVKLSNDSEFKTIKILRPYPIR